MKNYKLLVPIFLIVLFAASFYMLYDSKSSELQEYHAYLDAARTYSKQGILVDAEANYMAAAELRPSPTLYQEIGMYYRETEQNQKASNWAETMLKKYPKSPVSYEYQMSMLMEDKDYTACFRLYQTFQARGLKSEKVTEWIDSIGYAFYFIGSFQNVGIYSGGLCPVQTGDKWGYVNTTGGRVIPATFNKVGAFSGGLAPVVDRKGEAYFIDTTGNKKMIIENVEHVAELGLIENGIYSLFDGQSWGFYDSGYNLLFGGYEEVSSMGNGVAAVRTNGKWSLLNRTGTDLTSNCYDDVVMDEKQVVCRYDRIFISDGLRYYMIDASGNYIGDNTYQAAHLFKDNTYAAVMINGKWGFTDLNGKLVIDPQYEDARSFINGFAAVKQNGKWGYIRTDGAMVIEPQFTNAMDFNDHGGAFVLVNGEWQMLRLYKYNY